MGGKRFTFLLPLLACVLLVAGCGGTGAGKGGDKVSVRGTVASVDDGTDGKVKRILVEGVKEPDTEYDKAIVAVTGKTKLYVQRDGKKAKAAMSDLQKGIRVEVKFGDGPVAESYPVQAGATEVVILE